MADKNSWRRQHKVWLIFIICACGMSLTYFESTIMASDPHKGVSTVYHIDSTSPGTAKQLSKDLRRGYFKGGQILSVASTPAGGERITLLFPGKQTDDLIAGWLSILDKKDDGRRLHKVGTMTDATITVYRSESKFHSRSTQKTLHTRLERLKSSMKKKFAQFDELTLPVFVRNPLDGTLSVLVFSGAKDANQLPEQLTNSFRQANVPSTDTVIKLIINDPDHPAASYSDNGKEGPDSVPLITEVADAFNELATQKSKYREQQRNTGSTDERRELFAANDNSLIYLGNHTTNPPETLTHLVEMLGVRPVLDSAHAYEGEYPELNLVETADHPGLLPRQHFILSPREPLLTSNAANWLADTIFPLAQLHGAQVSLTTVGSDPIGKTIDRNILHIFGLAKGIDQKKIAILPDMNAIDSDPLDLFPLSVMFTLLEHNPDHDGDLEKAFLERNIHSEKISTPENNTPVEQIQPHLKIDPATLFWRAHHIRESSKYVNFMEIPENANLLDNIEERMDAGEITFDDLPVEIRESPLLTTKNPDYLRPPIAELDWIPDDLRNVLTDFAEAVGIVTSATLNFPELSFESIRREWKDIYSSSIIGSPNMLYVFDEKAVERDAHENTDGQKEQHHLATEDDPKEFEKNKRNEFAFTDLPTDVLNEVPKNRSLLDFSRPAGATADMFENYVLQYLLDLEQLSIVIDAWLSENTDTSLDMHRATSKLRGIVSRGLAEANVQLELIAKQQSDFDRIKEIEKFIHALRRKINSNKFHRLTEKEEQQLLENMTELQYMSAPKEMSGQLKKRSSQGAETRTTEAGTTKSEDTIAATVGTDVTTQWFDTRTKELTDRLVTFWQNTPKPRLSKHSSDTLTAHFLMGIASVLSGAREPKFLRRGLTAPKLATIESPETKLVAKAAQLEPILRTVAIDHPNLSANTSQILTSTSPSGEQQIATNPLVKDASSKSFEAQLDSINKALDDPNSDISQLFSKYHLNQRVFFVPKVTKLSDGSIQYHTIVERFSTGDKLLGHEDDARDLHLGTFVWENARASKQPEDAKRIINVPKLAQYINVLIAMKKAGATAHQLADMRLERRKDSIAPKLNDSTVVAELEEAINSLIQDPSSSEYGPRLGELMSVDTQYRIAFKVQQNENSKSENPSQFLIPSLTKVTDDS